MNIIIDEISLFGQGLIDDAVEESLNAPDTNLPMDLLGCMAVSRLENSNGQIDRKYEKSSIP